MVTKFPPFTKVVRVLCTAVNEQDVVDTTRNIYKAIQQVEKDNGKFVYLGASKSPVTKMNGLCRYQILMRVVPDEFERIIEQIYAITDENRSKNATFSSK